MAEAATAERTENQVEGDTPQAQSANGAAPTPEKTADERKAEIRKEIAGHQEAVDKAQRSLKVLESSGETGLDSVLDNFRATVEKSTKAIERLNADLENVDREEQLKSVAAPLLAALGKRKIENAFLLPETVHFEDIDKMISDNENAAKKALAMMQLLKAIKSTGEKLPNPDVLADLPPLKITHTGDNTVSFGFAEKKSRARSAGTGKSSGGMRATAQVRRIVASNEPSHIGWLIGKHDDAKYPSWQALFDDIASDSEKERLKNQSRNMKEWYERQFKATIEDVAAA